MKDNLTREECENALSDLFEIYDRYLSKSRKPLLIMEKLIKEHFDNPPLCYEEIEEDVWYWHNNKKEWVYILKKDVCTSDVPILETLDEYIHFELNCFYRKKVE